MRTILTCAATLAMVALAWGAETPTPPATKKTPARRPGNTGVAKKSRAKPVASSKPLAKPAAGGTTAAPRRGKKAPVLGTTWRNRQTAPTPDRFKEIQTALADKGYLTSEEANGTWAQSSADALKKFQADQNLETTGKIDALSLIALGLGPRHESAPPRPLDVNSAQPPQPPQPESSARN